MILQGKVWGSTSPLFKKNNVEIHLIDIKKGGYCSKHLHNHKYNKFIVLNGKLKIIIWKDYGTEILEDVSILHTNEECTVHPGDYHRFEALEDTKAFEIYWTEINDSDIVREDHGGIYAEKADKQSDNNNGSDGYRKYREWLFSRRRDMHFSNL